LAKAVEDARGRAQVLARAAGRGLGRIVAVAEAGAAPVPTPERVALGGSAASMPVVPGERETTASVTVTFELR
ncbi:MAG TPA: SIMPL domain-containing protein, partial [Gaiellaceae bacterium]|nr:SIMPL domain-containing protein [Gaiellaceae bacterium]